MQCKSGIRKYGYIYTHAKHSFLTQKLKDWGWGYGAYCLRLNRQEGNEKIKLCRFSFANTKVLVTCA